MQYFQIDDNTWIEYNETTNKVVILDKEVVTKEKQDAEERLKEIPEKPKDAELLEWAKKNYPYVDYSVERTNLEEIVGLSNTRLEVMK